MNCENILRKYVSVGKSKIHGKGIIADNDILENTYIKITHQWNYINHSDKPNCELLDVGPENRKLKTLRRRLE